MEIYYHINRTQCHTKNANAQSNIFPPLPFFLETKEHENNTEGVLSGRNFPGKGRGEFLILI